MVDEWLNVGFGSWERQRGLPSTPHQHDRQPGDGAVGQLGSFVFRRAGFQPALFGVRRLDAAFLPPRKKHQNDSSDTIKYRRFQVLPPETLSQAASRFLLGCRGTEGKFPLR